MAYYVWCIKHGLPRVVHSDYAMAVAEARRLAEKYKGEKFMVMVAKITVCCAKMPTFVDVKIGQQFRHSGRLLIKTETVSFLDHNGYRQHYNAVRIEPSEFAGRLSTISDSTVVEILG